MSRPPTRRTTRALLLLGAAITIIGLLHTLHTAGGH